MLCQVGSLSQRKVAFVITALALGSFAIGTAEFAAMSLLPYYSSALHVSAERASHAISAYALGVVVGAPVLAVVGANIARRRLLLILMSAFAISNILSTLVPSYGWLVASRFVAGLPHGAYFGVAALVATDLVQFEKRTRAVAMVMTGLSVSTIVGVPLANTLGRSLDWRWGFGVIGATAVIATIAIFFTAPREAPRPYVSALGELKALCNSDVWLTLGIGAVGYGGIFAVYTYLASTMIEVTQASGVMVTLVLALFGVGMTIGTLVCAWAADRALMPAIAGTLLWSIAALSLYPASTGNGVSLAIIVFLIGAGGGLGTMLQARLMDVAGEAQTLAAALNHSAMNTANALGPWLAGLFVGAGFGLPFTGWVGATLALGGA